MAETEQCIRIEIILDPGDGDYVVTLETGFDNETKPRWRAMFKGPIEACISASINAWTDMQVAGAILALPIRTNLRGHEDICEGADAQHFFHSVALGIRDMDPEGIVVAGSEMFGRPQ
jgi:hypothetical protein